VVYHKIIFVLIITFAASTFFIKILETMSDEHNEYEIETVDAGASATIPMEAGQVKKGG
jgi:hypothetical protein